MLFYIFFLYYILQLTSCEWRNAPHKTNDITRRPGYGITWMYFPDGDGFPQIANLTTDTEHEKRTHKHIEKRVTFTVYTKENQCGFELKLNDSDSFRQTKFNVSQIKFLIHGWQSSKQSPHLNEIKMSYLLHTDNVVIVVDWSSLAKSVVYMNAAKDTRLVGNYIAKIMKYLNESGAATKNIHCIGHSLGSHVCGFAGASMGGQLGRITGLDPAKPMFAKKDINERLDKTDAKFVDIIHTCGGTLGDLDELGHIDFFPNGGTPSQPGCYYKSAVLQEACSHSRAWQFFMESIIKPKTFPSYLCDSWDNFKEKKCTDAKINNMGEYVDPTTNGSFYLYTSAERPFKGIKEAL